jgi:hypothetical protein
MDDVTELSCTLVLIFKMVRNDSLKYCRHGKKCRVEQVLFVWTENCRFLGTGQKPGLAPHESTGTACKVRLYQFLLGL